MPPRSAKDGRRGRIFLAVKSRSTQYQSLFIGGTLGACGVMIIVTALYLIWAEGAEGLYLFIGALGLVVVVIGVDILGHTMPEMDRESVVVDNRSARLLDGGKLVKEFTFGNRVRLGATFNSTFHVPTLKPLYGIEFERGGDTIVVSPGEGYTLNHVERLWPLALALARKYDMQLTPGLRKHLEGTREDGGYWAKVASQLLGEGETPLVERDEKPSM